MITFREWQEVKGEGEPLEEVCPGRGADRRPLRISKASERLLVWEYPSYLVGVLIPSWDRVGPLGKEE